MSKQAEELANKRWPIHYPTISPKEGEHGEILNFDEWLDDHRIAVQSYSANRGFIQGYEQAEKDLALTWEDMRTIASIFHSMMADMTVDDSVEDRYKEVLRRFNEQRRK